MSKIGRLPITIPAGVTLSIVGSLVKVTGPKGELSYQVTPKIITKLEGNQVTVTRTSEDKPTRALHGLTRSLIANMVVGVSTGFTKTLELQGTGYRARLAGNNLVLSLGFSHEIEYTPPTGVILHVENTTTIIISGFDRQQVGQAAAKIRSFKKPEPYKGKGIRYQGEIVRRK